MIHFIKLSGKPEPRLATLHLPAAMESLESFRSFVLRELGREKGLDGLASQVDLILEEVLVNAINYAYPLGNGEIEVECMAEGPEMFRVAVGDWGVPLNPLDQPAPDPMTDIAKRRVGGLGIYLAKQMASRLIYEYRDGGNTLMIWIGKQ
jgi:serine/threonine-protein kinase RsbW